LQVRCPQCSAENKISGRETRFRCQYCGSQIEVHVADERRRFYVSLKVEPDRVDEILRGWMSEGDKPRKLVENHIFHGSELVWVPVVYAKAFRMSMGRKLNMVWLESGSNNPWVNDQTKGLLPLSNLAPLEDMEILPGKVVELEEEIESYRQRMRMKYTDEADIEQIFPVYFPIFEVKYSYRGQTRSAAVEGVTGQVIAFEYPRKSVAPFIALGTFSFVASMLIGFVALSLFNQSVPIAVAGVVILMIPIYLTSEWLMRNV
jgi:DNA-directed RNA polymerase subunit RPC12/RpoP